MRLKAGLSLLLICSAIAPGIYASNQTSPQRAKAQAPRRKTTARKTAEPKFKITPDLRSALDLVSADSLKGHLSFIASDHLEGRNTPSRGLDTAAHYIAAQFRRAGLEPAGDDGFFQTARWLLTARSLDSFDLTLNDGKDSASAGKERVSFNWEGELKFAGAPVLKVDYNDSAALAALTPEQLTGKVVLTEIPDFRREDRSRWQEMMRAQNAFTSKMQSSKVKLVISVDRVESAGTGGGTGRLIDPENRTAPRGSSSVPVITVHEPRFVQFHDSAKPGLASATVSLNLPAAVETPVNLRNVIGILRGSDPVLKDTYVLLTAHYDHIGMRPAAGGDGIYNGANDDGSGTVSVIELASALTRLKQRPRRSIVFMTFFGEEKGLLGSRYYGRRPVFPIDKTIANINLEQVGRTDSTEGPQLSNATMTGFDYSDVGTIFQAAGELTGVNVYKHDRNSDSYFGRSDNQALADRGVPAHTLCVAYAYPDYHDVGDHWEKIDYENMGKVNRMIALALIMIADNSVEPKWNEANPKTARYVKAWKERRGM
ncbi:MAG TPA: M28 family peptidase [Blastocatellia bacterium]|nr:M28 family peptidase [Blastocatellia bacterium]